MAIGKLKRLAKKKTTTTTKKSVHPEFEDEGLAPNIEAIYEAKKNEKTAKAKFRKAEALVLEKANQARDEFCQTQGKYESSVKMSAGGQKVTIKFPNRYSKMATDDKEALEEIFEDETDRWFKEKTSVSMTETAMNDEAFIDTIIASIGEDKFDKYFNVEEHLEVSKTYHEARTTDPSLAVKHQEAVDAGLVRPTKPSVTLG